jgi:hypothetical protein
MEKTLDLRMSGLQEMRKEELIEINGGGWLADAWDWVKNAATDTWEWIKVHVGIVPMQS